MILALATAATVFEDSRYRDLALQTWEFMQRRFRDHHGGLIWHIGRDGQILDDVRSQNPLMHTFEALLVLAPLDESGTVRRMRPRSGSFNLDARSRLLTGMV